jgi:hypothetical protein
LSYTLFETFLIACSQKQQWIARRMFNATLCSNSPEAVDMNRRFQMQGGKNWILPK